MPPRKRQEAKQVVNVSVRVGDTAKKPKKRSKPRRRLPKSEGGIAQVGQTGTQYLGLQNLPPAPPQIPFYSPGQYYPSLPANFQPQKAPSNIAGLLEDVKQERSNLLEDIKTATRSEAIKQVQKAQGAEQRAELERIGFQTPVKQANILDKAVSEPVATYTDIVKQPIITEPEDEYGSALPFQDAPFLMIEDVKKRVKRPNRPKEEIIAERERKQAKKEERLRKKQEEMERKERMKALEEIAKTTKMTLELGQPTPKKKLKVKSNLPVPNLEEKATIAKSTQSQFNLA
jgi:hypothetical protein